MRHALFLFFVLLSPFGCVMTQSWSIQREGAFRRAQAEYLGGEFEKAAKFFFSYADCYDSASPDLSLYWMGMSRLQTGRFDAAKEAFSTVLEGDPPPIFRRGALVGMGRACLGLREYEDAEACFNEVLAGKPLMFEPSIVRLQLATALVRQGKWDAAVDACNHIIESGASGAIEDRAWEMIAFSRNRAFTIQLGVFTSRPRAESEARSVRSRGLDARVVELRRVQGNLFAVCAGSFRTSRGAHMEITRLRASGVITDAVVKP
jgi:tetratricopeptide (TPR) repeat protein